MPEVVSPVADRASSSDLRSPALVKNSEKQNMDVVINSSCEYLQNICRMRLLKKCVCVCVLFVYTCEFEPKVMALCTVE